MRLKGSRIFYLITIYHMNKNIPVWKIVSRYNFEDNVTYINENKDTTEIKISTYLLMVLTLIIITLLFATGIITIEKAWAYSINDAGIAYHFENHSEQPMQRYPYHVAPRLFQNCQSSFIGYEYDQTKDIPCRKLWNQWTYEMREAYHSPEIISYTYTKEIPFIIIP